MEKLIIGIAAFFVLICSAFLNAFALTKLWGWFIVTTFGLPALGMAQAYGVMLVISFLTYQFIETQSDDPLKSLCTSMGFAVMKPLTALLFGWIVHGLFF